MMLIFFSSPPFYTQYVHLPPVGAPTPPIIRNNPKYYPFFKDALGAIDGTHINCSASAEMRQAARDRKGGVTQNCLAICGFDMIFYYIFSGWDGSAADSTMFYDARMTDLHIPADKYYLADAGFPICDALIIPKRGVRYHLAEWGWAQQRCRFFYSILLWDLIFGYRPANADELFNLRHASARNVIERIFGVLKRRFRILVYPAEISMDYQARIPAALAAIHNFICIHDPEEIEGFVEADDVERGFFAGELAEGQTRAAEKRRANTRRDGIAAQMWEQYHAELQERGTV